MPAAAVIPAPRVYIKVVAVKKLVVGSKSSSVGSGLSGSGKGLSFLFLSSGTIPLAFPDKGGVVGFVRVYFEKIRVFKAGASP